MALLIKAGQMTASDYVPIYPDLPLASKGASTEDVCSGSRVIGSKGIIQERRKFVEGKA